MKLCPRCESEKTVKNGFLYGKPRRRCNACSYQYTKSYRGQISPQIKRRALELYLEGLGFRSIGRLLNCSHVSVYNWVCSFGEQLKALRKDTDIEIMEIDEMHTYIQSKKTTAGSGLLLIDVGSNLSIVCLETETQKPVGIYGTRSRKQNLFR